MPQGEEKLTDYILHHGLWQFDTPEAQADEQDRRRKLWNGSTEERVALSLALNTIPANDPRAEQARRQAIRDRERSPLPETPVARAILLGMARMAISYHRAATELNSLYLSNPEESDFREVLDELIAANYCDSANRLAAILFTLDNQPTQPSDLTERLSRQPVAFLDGDDLTVIAPGSEWEPGRPHGDSWRPVSFSMAKVLDARSMESLP